MDSQPNPHSDRKLLFAVAGCVVVGAMAVALIAGWTALDDRARETAAPARAASPSKPVPPVRPEPVPRVLETSETVAVAEDDDASSGEAVLDIDPSADPWAEGVRAWEARDYARAAAYLAVDAERRPDRAYTHYLLGLSLWKVGRLDAAVEAMERSSGLNDRSIRTFVNLARIQLARGETDAAMESAERALALDAGSTTALYQKARALYAADRVDEAVATLESCVELDGAAGQAHNLLGLIRLRRGEWVAALSSLEVAAALLPDTAYAQNNYGLALERAGRFEEAVVAFRRATAADPDHAAAQVSLARLSGLGIDEASGEEPLALARGLAETPGDTSPAPETGTIAEPELAADAGSSD